MSLGALVLSAGLGSRLAPFTESRAKPAIPFFGVPMLFHALRPLECLDVKCLVANLHYRPEDIRALLRTAWNNRLPVGSPVQFSEENPNILGSGGAIAQALNQTRIDQCSNILVVNGDEIFLPFTPRALQLIHEFHCTENNLATLVTINHPGVGSEFGGVFVDEAMSVRRFSKQPIEGLRGLHYVGYAFLNSSIKDELTFPPQEENLLYDTLTRAIAKGKRVRAVCVKANWFEVGNPKSFMNSTGTLLDLIFRYGSETWVREFNGFLLKQRPWQYLIEKQDYKLLTRLQDFHAKLVQTQPKKI